MYKTCSHEKIFCFQELENPVKVQLLNKWSEYEKSKLIVLRRCLHASVICLLVFWPMNHRNDGAWSLYAPRNKSARFISPVHIATTWMATVWFFVRSQQKIQILWNKRHKSSHIHNQFSSTIPTFDRLLKSRANTLAHNFQNFHICQSQFFKNKILQNLKTL